MCRRACLAARGPGLSRGRNACRAGGWRHREVCDAAVVPVTGALHEPVSYISRVGSVELNHAAALDEVFIFVPGETDTGRFIFRRAVDAGCRALVRVGHNPGEALAGPRVDAQLDREPAVVGAAPRRADSCRGAAWYLPACRHAAGFGAAQDAMDRALGQHQERVAAGVSFLVLLPFGHFEELVELRDGTARRRVPSRPCPRPPASLSATGPAGPGEAAGSSLSAPGTLGQRGLDARHAVRVDRRHEIDQALRNLAGLVRYDAYFASCRRELSFVNSSQISQRTRSALHNACTCTFA